MTPYVIESGNRRAEINGNTISFQKITGNVRRSKHGVWKMECDDTRRARRLAKRWALLGRLGEPVLH